MIQSFWLLKCKANKAVIRYHPSQSTVGIPHLKPYSCYLLAWTACWIKQDVPVFHLSVLLFWEFWESQSVWCVPFGVPVTTLIMLIVNIEADPCVVNMSPCISSFFLGEPRNNLEIVEEGSGITWQWNQQILALHWKWSHLIYIYFQLPARTHHASAPPLCVDAYI